MRPSAGAPNIASPAITMAIALTEAPTLPTPPVLSANDATPAISERDARPETDDPRHASTGEAVRTSGLRPDDRHAHGDRCRGQHDLITGPHAEVAGGDEDRRGRRGDGVVATMVERLTDRSPGRYGPA